jgi:hypothetical protein
MRVLRALFIALLTAFAGCLLAFFVGDYLTRLAHVPEMEGQRGMTVFFLCVPLGILAGLVIGIVSAIVVRRQGFAGFLVAQGWSLLIVCGLPIYWPAFHICYRTNLQQSMASTSSCSSSFAPQQQLKFQISPVVTASESLFTLTIGKISTLSLTGTGSQKMPNIPRFPDMCRC